MKFPHIKQSGMALIIVGAILLILGKITGLTQYNWLLVSALLLVIFGVILYIIELKKHGDY